MRPPWNWLLTDYGSHYTVVLWSLRCTAKGRLIRGRKVPQWRLEPAIGANAGNAANIQIQSMNTKRTGAVWKLNGPNNRTANTMNRWTRPEDCGACRS